MVETHVVQGGRNNIICWGSGCGLCSIGWSFRGNWGEAKQDMPMEIQNNLLFYTADQILSHLHMLFPLHTVLVNPVVINPKTLKEFAYMLSFYPRCTYNPKGLGIIPGSRQQEMVA